MYLKTLIHKSINKIQHLYKIYSSSLVKGWSTDLGKKGSKVEMTVKTTTSARTVNTSSLPAHKRKESQTWRM
jgi:hypothetical protein